LLVIEIVSLFESMQRRRNVLDQIERLFIIKTLGSSRRHCLFVVVRRAGPIGVLRLANWRVFPVSGDIEIIRDASGVAKTLKLFARSLRGSRVKQPTARARP
jgi:hypothetical protein